MKTLLLPLVTLSTAVASRVDPAALLAQMTVQQKVGQMTQLNIDQVMMKGSSSQLDPAKLAQVFDTYGVGSIINTPISGCGVDNQQEWRTLLTSLQTYVLNYQTNMTPPIPLLYGLDSVHGGNYIFDATLFPHNTGAAATFEPSFYRLQSAITALETRSVGIGWMFSPVLGLGRNSQWSRLYETLGEDPYVGKIFADAYIQGAMQTVYEIVPTLNTSSIPCAPCAKHFFGYSDSKSGKDRTDAWIPDAYLKQYFEPSFAAAMAANNPSIMINSASINGIPAHASKTLLTDILRTELGFTGVAVTDWQDIEKLQIYHALAATPAEAIILALNAGVDMSMVPDDFSFPQVLVALVQNGTIPESRLDESVLRILQFKIDLGLFEDPVVPPALENFNVGQDFALEIALNATRESITLLQNQMATNGKPTLPLPNWLPSGGKILLVGPSYSMTSLCGGWTYAWQGIEAGGSCPPLPTKGGMSSLDVALTNLSASFGYSVTAFQGVNFSDYTQANLQQAATLAAAADVILFAVGEGPESETPGDTNDLTLSPSQVSLFTAISAAVSSKNTPIVTILVEPRPRILGSIAEGSAAILMAYLPCTMGGQAISEILLGITNPSGRLPITYPRSTNDLDVYYHKPWNAAVEAEQHVGIGVGVGADVDVAPIDPDTNAMYHYPLFQFGSGMSYSTVAYSNVQLSSSAVPATSIINVTLTINNAGPYDTKETVLVFIRQLSRAAITPEQRLLKAFAKVFVASDSSAQVSIPLDTSEFFYWTPSLERAIDAGVYSVNVGNTSLMLTLTTGGVFEWSMKEGTMTQQQKTKKKTTTTHENKHPVWTFVVEESGDKKKNKMTAETTTTTTTEEGLVNTFIEEMFADNAVRATGPLARSVAKHQLKEKLMAKRLG